MNAHELARSRFASTRDLIGFSGFCGFSRFTRFGEFRENRLRMLTERCFAPNLPPRHQGFRQDCNN